MVHVTDEQVFSVRENHPKFPKTINNNVGHCPSHMENETNSQLGIEQVRDRMEKVMLELPSKPSFTPNGAYLGGYIDALADSGQIDETVRAQAYNEFASVK